MLLDVKNFLPSLCTTLQIPKFNSSDLSYLEEYCSVMRPVAETIDFLQREEEMFFGYLLPAILSLRVKLENVKHECRIMQDEVQKLIDKLVERYSYIFNMTPEAKPLVIASSLHPDIKLKWVPMATSFNIPINVDAIKMIIQENIDNMINRGELNISCSPSSENYANIDRFFGFSETGWLKIFLIIILNASKDIPFSESEIHIFFNLLMR